MMIRELKTGIDVYAMQNAQRRTYSTHPRRIKMSVAETLKKKAAALRAAKNGKQVSKNEPKKKSVEKKSTAKKSAATKNGHSTPREQIKDKKGKVVAGRGNTFVCVECGEEISGPWSYKMHLVNQHNYNRKRAGLREAK